MNKLNLFIFLILGCWSCNNIEKKNIELVKSFIEYSNNCDTFKINQLLSNDFDKQNTILLKDDYSDKKQLIDKEKIIIDSIQIIDKNTIKTIEHIQDVYSDFFNLDMPKYEIIYFVANSKIISITVDMDRATDSITMAKKIKHIELVASFNNWFSNECSKFNNKDYLLENGLYPFLTDYSKLDSSIINKYKFKIKEE